MFIYFSKQASSKKELAFYFKHLEFFVNVTISVIYKPTPYSRGFNGAFDFFMASSMYIQQVLEVRYEGSYIRKKGWKEKKKKRKKRDRTGEVIVRGGKREKGPIPKREGEGARNSI